MKTKKKKDFEWYCFFSSLEKIREIAEKKSEDEKYTAKAKKEFLRLEKLIYDLQNKIIPKIK